MKACITKRYALAKLKVMHREWKRKRKAQGLIYHMVSQDLWRLDVKRALQSKRVQRQLKAARRR